MSLRKRIPIIRIDDYNFGRHTTRCSGRPFFIWLIEYGIYKFDNHAIISARDYQIYKRDYHLSVNATTFSTCWV